ncbi:MAG: tyrosine-type recombinase/integrase [Propionibacteriaceae bacterium]|nr:tyrosine-type recombinase/integrase [Propionibacteriaceae bacterium]
MNWDEHLSAYLRQRRGLGFQLMSVERALRGFCAWMEARGGADVFSLDDAVAWARGPAGTTPAYQAGRLSMLRGFAAWLNTVGVDVPVIPAGLLRADANRAVPYIYTQADLDALLAACPGISRTSRVGVMMGTLIGLLASTGLRPGEALNLRESDIDADQAVLFVSKGKGSLARRAARSAVRVAGGSRPGPGVTGGLVLLAIRP